MRRHRSRVKKLGRTRDARKALLRGLLRSLVLYGHVETSRPRAKALRAFADRLVTTARKETVAAKRHVLAALGGDEETVARLFKKLPAFKERTSGLTRLIPLSERRGDGSLRTRIEWTDKEKKVSKVPKVSNAKAEEKKDVNTQNLSTKS